MKAQTVAFATLVAAQLIHVFDCRSSRSIFHRNIFQNKALVFAVLSSLVLMLAVMYIDPLQPIFKTVDLGLKEWILALVAAGIPTFFFGIGSVVSGTKKKRPPLVQSGAASGKKAA
jgi:Ca2+-transporting ATPase